MTGSRCARGSICDGATRGFSPAVREHHVAARHSTPRPRLTARYASTRLSQGTLQVVDRAEAILIVREAGLGGAVPKP